MVIESVLREINLELMNTDVATLRTVAAYLNGILGETARQKYGPRLKSIDLIHIMRLKLREMGF